MRWIVVVAGLVVECTGDVVELDCGRTALGVKLRWSLKLNALGLLWMMSWRSL